MADLPKCRWCGGAPHKGLWCPLVKALTFFDEFPDIVQTVEFHDPQPMVVLNNPPLSREPGVIVELKK